MDQSFGDILLLVYRVWIILNIVVSSLFPGSEVIIRTMDDKSFYLLPGQNSRPSTHCTNPQNCFATLALASTLGGINLPSRGNHVDFAVFGIQSGITRIDGVSLGQDSRSIAV